MKKKIFLSFVVICVLVISVSIFAACDQSNPSEGKHWFSSFSKQFVEYDDTKDNLADAGTIWTMTVKNDCNIGIAFRNNSTSMHTGTAFYVNGKQVQSEVPDFYEYEFKNLNLKKGDTIKIHAFSTNSIMAFTEQLNMDVFAIIDGSNTYLVNDIK